MDQEPRQQPRRPQSARGKGEGGGGGGKSKGGGGKGGGGGRGKGGGGGKAKHNDRWRDGSGGKGGAAASSQNAETASTAPPPPPPGLERGGPSGAAATAPQQLQQQQQPPPFPQRSAGRGRGVALGGAPTPAPTPARTLGGAPSPPLAAKPAVSPPVPRPQGTAWDGMPWLRRRRDDGLEQQLPAEEAERNAERRAEERMVLEAIYADDVQAVEAGGDGDGDGEALEVLELKINPQLPSDTIRLEAAAPLLARFPRAPLEEVSDDEAARGVRSVQLPSVPPLLLRLRLPASYPSRAPPAFGLSCAWLSDARLEGLARRLDTLWDEARADAGGEGAEVISVWVEAMRAEAVEGGEGTPPLEVVSVPSAADDEAQEAQNAAEAVERRGVRWPRAAEEVLGAMLRHNDSAQEEKWARQITTCGICFDDFASVDCSRFVKCGHAFCRGCVRGYFESQMGEGALGGMVCPEPSCRKQATPDEVLAALPAELRDKFEKLSLERSLAEMSDVAWCPRCEYPALLEEEGSRLATCGQCRFAFCVECGQTWHGLAPCANLAARWKAADEAGREALRKKYGAAILDEVESSAWMSEHTKPCPKCNTPVEKNGGCNHITCRKCSHEWCWLCGVTYQQGHFKNGVCEQFSQDFFDEINLSREEFRANYVVLNHW